MRLSGLQKQRISYMLVSDWTKSVAAEMKDTGTKANTRHAYTNKVLIRLGGSVCCGGWTLSTTNTAIGSTWDSIKGMSISLLSGGVLSK